MKSCAGTGILRGVQEAIGQVKEHEIQEEEEGIH